MKEYPLRSNTETVDVCECGHENEVHEFRFIELFMIRNNDFTGKCSICTCPKYIKEKTMLKKEYLDIKNTRSMST